MGVMEVITIAHPEQSSGELKIDLSIKNVKVTISIPRHTIVVGYHGFTMDVCESVRPSVSCTPVRPFFVSASMDFHQTWYVY